MCRYCVVLLAILMVSYFPLANGTPYSQHIEIITDHDTYLTSDTVNVSYYVFDVNGRVVSGGNGTWHLVRVYNNYNITTGKIYGGHGYFTIDLSKFNLTGGYETYEIVIDYHSNKISIHSSANIYVVGPDISWYTIYVSPLSGGYYPGHEFKVNIDSLICNINGDYLSLQKDGAIWKNFTNFRINEKGTAQWVFTIPNNWKEGTKVTITAEIKGKTEKAYFTVSRYYGLNLVIKDKSMGYVSGDEIYILIKSKPISNPYYHFYIRSDKGLLYKYFTYHNYTTYTIPNDFAGNLIIDAEVFNSSAMVGRLSKLITVSYGYARLIFDRSYYHGNDRLTAKVVLESNVMKNCTYTYQLFEIESSLNLIMEKTTKEDHIEIDVPPNPPMAYYVAVTITDDKHILNTGNYISYKPSVVISAYLLTPSSYTTGVFAPGDTVEIHYSITGDFRYPASLFMGFDKEIYENPKVKMVSGNTSGNITFKIPENLATGTYVYHIKLAYMGVVQEKDVFIHVSQNPPWSQYMIIGMPAGDFVTIIVVAAIALLAVGYTRLPPQTKKESDESIEDQNDSK